MSRRVRARVDGVVQGVGFRPYVFRLAREHALAGFVLNDERGVLVEVEGEDEAVDAFLARLPREAPPLAAVHAVTATELGPEGGSGFRIVESAGAGEPDALVTPDAATCDDCLAELFDPADRRYRYPFVNCTNCGPRFTIVRGVPYDRPLTTMAGFAMCPACRAEYDDPADRRFHAQPNACPTCGPRARLLDAEGAEQSGDDPVRAAAEALRGGAIVAVKGLGGYHLACRADAEAAVAALRGRKHREDKPFALMAPDRDRVRALVDLAAEEERLLLGRARPIVLARRRPGAPVAASVAAGSPDLGVMLPYTPVHHLLLADAGLVLVMTSGNVSDEPIAYEDEDALKRLRGIADRFLVHDRPIHMRTDDSVLRAVASDARRALVLRRSRGYVPDAMSLPVDVRPALGCGAELKSTFCVAKDGRAWVGHHIGDLQNWETLRSFREGVEHFERLFAVVPEVVAHDLHPDYLSSRYALEREDVAHVGVQHHHAHLAACLAEHGVLDRAVGAIYDGAGHGPDGTVWGGELLVGDLGSFERAGHLWPVRLPGGDRAAREPWRMACAWLVAAGDDAPAVPERLAGRVDPDRWRQVTELCRGALPAPVTTSAGRLFDAVAALAGLRAVSTYEGQAAVALEGAIDAGEPGAYPMPAARADDGAVTIDARETVAAVARDVAAGVDPGGISARFHRGFADATVAGCALVAQRAGVDLVVLSGGVWQNRALVERTRSELRRLGLRVLVPRALPPNDGGIAYGQVAVASRRTATTSPQASANRPTTA
jgi:hydrogenase maturation protein HypF